MYPVSTQAVAGHDLNATSSRSHLILGILIVKRDIVKNKGDVAKVTSGKMSLIDLAGSESAKKTSIRILNFFLRF